MTRTCKIAGSTRTARCGLAVAVALVAVAAAVGLDGDTARAQAPRPDVAERVLSVSAESGAVRETATEPAPHWSLDEGVLLPDDWDALAYQMTPVDARRYARIFEMQGRGDWAAADREIARLSDRRLMGHVTAQRLLHPTDYRASWAELRDWLDRYADLPVADQVHRLAVRRQPRGERPPRAPVGTTGLAGGNLESYDNNRPLDVSPRGRGERPSGQVERVADLLRTGDALGAFALFDLVGDDVDPRAKDAVQVELAAALFYAGQHRDALRLAGEVAGRAGASLPLSHWIAGLASWRLNQIDRAGRHFEAMARVPGVSAWDLSGAAFWAARAHMRAGRGHQVSPWLERAAAYPRTFYGLVARRLLGLDIAFRWDVPTITAAHLKVLSATPAGERAIGLLQAGQRELAEAELRRIHPQGETLLEEALLTIAVQAKLPSLALQVGNALSAPEGSTWDAALYPVPPWDPSEGFAVDRALVYALMRQESRFDPRARSPVGASGLMQLMPATAGAMAGQPMRGAQSEQLFDPTVNVTLGQRYITHLLQQPEIGNNLLVMLAAYNAGPNAIARWRKQMQAEHDPLLFIETIPARETRGFLERVLANHWIYRLRLGRDVPALDAIAAGQWPIYLPETEDAVEMADTDGAH